MGQDPGFSSRNMLINVFEFFCRTTARAQEEDDNSRQRRRFLKHCPSSSSTTNQKKATDPSALTPNSAHKNCSLKTMRQCQGSEREPPALLPLLRTLRVWLVWPPSVSPRMHTNPYSVPGPPLLLCLIVNPRRQTCVLKVSARLPAEAAHSMQVSDEQIIFSGKINKRTLKYLPGVLLFAHLRWIKDVVTDEGNTAPFYRLHSTHIQFIDSMGQARVRAPKTGQWTKQKMHVLMGLFTHSFLPS